MIGPENTNHHITKRVGNKVRNEVAQIYHHVRSGAVLIKIGQLQFQNHYGNDYSNDTVAERF